MAGFGEQKNVGYGPFKKNKGVIRVLWEPF